MTVFKSKSVKLLQEYLKERGVVYLRLGRATSLKELCILAKITDIEIDPDRSDTVANKLATSNRFEMIKCENADDDSNLTANIGIVFQDAKIGIFDVFTNLIGFVMHESNEMKGVLYWAHCINSDSMDR